MWNFKDVKDIKDLKDTKDFKVPKDLTRSLRSL